MIKTLISQTKTETKIGTPLNKASLPSSSFPKPLWPNSAKETAHQVSMAFMVAARNHAPSKYHTSSKRSLSLEGVNKRAIPAKSIPQKANDRIVDQRIPAKRKSPSKSVSANSVVL
jgi:hypothetical protein